MLLNLALWVQATGFFTYLRGSGFVYPVILSMHMVAIAFFGGMILMTDMRMLGLAFTKRPVADLVDQLRVPKRWGLLLAATCGFLLFCCKAEEYYYNVFFRVKVTLFCVVIVHALLFRSSVYAKAAEFDREGRVPGAAKLAAGLSLLLWISIACMGRGIGYIEPPFGIHAQAAPGRLLKTCENRLLARAAQNRASEFAGPYPAATAREPVGGRVLMSAQSGKVLARKSLVFSATPGDSL